MVWFIEAKFRSDVSERTTNNPERDQVIRNPDVGTWYAGVRHFYFSLLLLDSAINTKSTGWWNVTRCRATKCCGGFQIRVRLLLAVKPRTPQWC